MIDSFTLVPAGDFRAALARLERRAGADPAMHVARVGAETYFYCCGDELVRRALRAHGGEAELAYVRASESAGILHVTTIGYEASVVHLHELLVWILAELGPCTVYDDASGEDISAHAARFPSSLLFDDVEEPEVRTHSDVRELAPPPPTTRRQPPKDDDLAGLVDIPIPGVRARR
jgi:hypothetical protein